MNNTHTWNNNSNIVREIYEDHTKIYLDDDTSYGYLCSPVLSGFVDIDFKVKLNDGAITDTFCGLFTTDSSGTVSGALNGFNLGQLGLTSADIGRWVDFHIGVLDDTIVLLCKDTGAMVKLSHTCPSYYIFSFALTGTLTSLDFKGVKINKCSDDLTMFVKDTANKFPLEIWSMGDYNHTLYFNANGGNYSTQVSDEYSSNGKYSAKVTYTGKGYVRYKITDVQEYCSKTIIFSANVNTPAPLELAIFYVINGQYTQVKVDIPADSCDDYTVSITLPSEGVSQILFSLDSRQTTTFSCYTDDWQLKIQ